MKKPFKFTFDVDAAAITLLDYYKEGEFAYEKGETKTEKQRNLKRDFKISLDNIIDRPELLKHSFCEALNDLFNICDKSYIEKLKEENRSLRKQRDTLQAEKDNEKACYLAQERDGWREEWFKTMRKEDAEIINTLRASINRSRSENEELLKYKRLYEQTNVEALKEDIENLRDINRDLNSKLFKLRQNTKCKSPKDNELQKKIEAKRKQMEKDKKELEMLMSKSNSEDNIDELVIDSEED